MNLFVSLLLGHILGDFYFQTKKMARHKMSFLRIHVGIYTAVMTLFYLYDVQDLSFIIFAAVIMVSHYYIDKYGMSEWVQSRFKNKPLNLFVLDQIAHIAVIVIYIFLYKLFEGQPSPRGLNLIILFSFIVLNLIMPCAIFIDKLMSQLMVEDVGEFSYSEGVVIGIAERLIVFFLALVGNLSALGFILAAKTMVRYGQFTEDDTLDNKVGNMTFRNKYLIGTLVSILLTLIHIAIYANYQIIELYYENLLYILIS